MTTAAYEMHTDGACSGNPGPGGWAAVLLAAPKPGAPLQVLGELHGGVPSATNNQMELQAVLQGLAKEPARLRDQPLQVCNDSQYLVKAFNEGWLRNWQQNEWRTANRKPVKNALLWQQLLALVSSRPGPITWKWEAGHAGNRWNERADRLAVAGSAAAQQTGRPSTHGAGCYQPAAGQKPAARPQPEPSAIENANIPTSSAAAALLLQQSQELDIRLQAELTQLPKQEPRRRQVNTALIYLRSAQEDLARAAAALEPIQD